MLNNNTISDFFAFTIVVWKDTIHHFESDLIKNMDHMRISGTELSSVILSQTK